MGGSRFIWLGVLVLILSACVPTTAPASTETSKVVPIATETETPEPTRTTTLTLTVSTTPTPWPTNTALPIPYPAKAEWLSFSPYDDWVAWGYRHEGRGPTIRVERFDQSVAWETDFDFYSYEWGRDGGIEVHFWDPDNRYIYLRIYGPSDGAYPRDGGNRLQQLDLETGFITTIISSDQIGYFASSFSPSGKKLAYISSSRTTVDVYVYDFTTQQTCIYPFGEQGSFAAGNIVWYEDETKLAFGVENYDTYRGNIFVLELEEDTGELIAQFETERFRPEVWISEDEVLIVHSGESLVVNVNNNELTPYEE